MILWIFALFLLGVSGWIGYQQGGIRVGFSFLGLLIGAVLAVPLGGLIKPLLPIFGLKHPVLLSFISPTLAFIVILAAFKTAAVSVHQKIDAYYKYNATDSQRSLFTILNQKLGIPLGLANATVYVFLLSGIIYVLGYFTYQVSGSEQDSASLKLANYLVQDLEKTGMRKAVSSLVPASEQFYDAADMIGDIFHNPLLQSRLSSYPPFLALAERPEFKSLGDDVKFQQFWLEGHSFRELLNHEKIKPLVENAELYTNVVGLLKGDFKDFKGYLETGSSAKYDEEKILGRWTFDFKESLARARKAKVNMTLEEVRRTRIALGKLANATISAMIDNQALLKMPSMNTEAQSAQGTWKDLGGGKYLFTLAEKDRKLDLNATIDGIRLLVNKDAYTLVFEK